MPKEVEAKIRKTVNKKHPNWTKEHKNNYIYGTMQKQGLLKKKAADGLINSGGQGQPPQGQPQQQQQPQQGQPQGGGVSVDVTMIATMNGQQQPLGNMKIASPDDLKKLVQTIVQVFQQGQQGGGQPQGGQPQGQPASQPASQPQGQPTQ